MRAEISSFQSARAELEQRLRDTQQALMRRLESAITEPLTVVETLRQDVETLHQNQRRSEQRTSTLRAEANEIVVKLDEIRREVSTSTSSKGELEGRVEKLQVDFDCFGDSRRV